MELLAPAAEMYQNICKQLLLWLYQRWFAKLKLNIFYIYDCIIIQ